MTDAYWYDAFGNVTSQAGGTYNPYKYVGSLGYWSADSADSGESGAATRLLHCPVH